LKRKTFCRLDCEATDIAII